MRGRLRRRGASSLQIAQNIRAVCTLCARDLRALLHVELPGHHYDGLLQSSSAATEPITPIISASCCGQTWWIAVISTSAPSV